MHIATVRHADVALHFPVEKFVVKGDHLVPVYDHGKTPADESPMVEVTLTEIPDSHFHIEGGMVIRSQIDGTFLLFAEGRNEPVDITLADVLRLYEEDRRTRLRAM